MRDPRGLIFLVGFMGAGKTTTGRALGRLLGWDFLDLDEAIEASERRTISRIFADEGERYFRRREAELLATLRGRVRVVIACGGGTYAQEENRTLIDGLGVAVWIHVPLAEALARCGSGSGRPLFKDDSQAEALYVSRLPGYRAARLRVEAAGLPAEQIAERIAELL
jgi:shikimate kinase